MATSGTMTAAFSGGSARLRLVVTRAGVSGNSSRYSWTLYADRLSGIAWSAFVDPWSVNVEGSSYSGSHDLDFRNGNTLVLGSGTTGWKQHNSQGQLTVNYSASMTATAQFGSASGSGSFASTQLAKAPDKPSAPTVTAVAAASASFSVAAPDNNGAAITQYQWQIDTQIDGPPNWSGSTYQTKTSSGRTVAFGTMQPDSAYAVRVRARNSVGWSPWSNIRSFSTGQVAAPTIVLSMNSKPFGVRIDGTGLPQTATAYLIRKTNVATSNTVTIRTSSMPYIDTNISVGTTYSYELASEIQAYTTPYSAPREITIQPPAVVGINDYFDGATPDDEAISYSWQGTAHASKSVASAPEATGWAINSLGGGSAILYQAPTSWDRDAGATVVFNAAATAPVIAGLDRADSSAWAVVEQGQVYVGSMYLQSTREQTMLAQITWMEADGGVLSTSEGDPFHVLAYGWDRLTVTATAPEGATRAVVEVRDATMGAPNEGFWQVGQSFTMDAAMLTLSELVPYFDGATADDGQYDYEWTGAADASASRRLLVYGADATDPLADPDCDPIPRAPRPPTIIDECIEEVGIWRRYWAVIDASLISDVLAILPTFTLTTGEVAERQVRIRVYENPECLEPGDYPAEAEWVSQQTISYLPANSTMVIDGLSERAYASVNGGESLAADRLLYGVNGQPATWGSLSCGQCYLVAFDVPLDAPEGNLTIDTALTVRY